jgi:hypothetical protein
MKTTIKILACSLAVALFGGLSVGCSDDTFGPGPQSVDTEEVYFVPTMAQHFELEPTDPTEYSFKVMRTESSAAITVPVKITGSEPEIFTASEITFAANQTETTCTVSFPKAKVGTTYDCVITISDPKYYKLYGLKSIAIAFDVTRVKWNLVGTGSFTYTFLYGGTLTKELYRRDKTDTYRIKNWGGNGANLSFELAADKTEFTITGSQYTGVNHNSYGPISITNTYGGKTTTNTYDPETKTYLFNLYYIVSAGSFGVMKESFVLDPPVEGGEEEE